MGWPDLFGYSLSRLIPETSSSGRFLMVTGASWVVSGSFVLSDTVKTRKTLEVDVTR